MLDTHTRVRVSSDRPSFAETKREIDGGLHRIPLSELTTETEGCTHALSSAQASVVGLCVRHVHGRVRAGRWTA